MLRNPDSAAAASERGGQKKLAFLSFGRWRDIPGSRTRTAANAYLQTIELAQAAEHIGFDGAFLRVHHFANLLSSPFPLLAAIGARTHRIEIGTGVVDLRYESPLHMAEAAAAVDLISGGRLQVGIGRGRPDDVLDGPQAFGQHPAAGQTMNDAARAKAQQFLAAVDGGAWAVAVADPDAGRTVAVQPQSPGLRRRVWWGSGTRESAEWAGALGMNLQSSTSLAEDTGAAFDQLQAEQSRPGRSQFCGS